MVDPNEAPDGYVAITQPYSVCFSCDIMKECYITIAFPCKADDREDGEDVIFIRKENAKNNG